MLARTLIPRLIVLLCCLSASYAYGASIAFDFSGRFGDCGGACGDAPLSLLVGASFEGTVSIPASAPELEPDSQSRPFGDEMTASSYAFSDTIAKFSFHTEGSGFDLVDAGPIQVTVTHCKGSLCSPNQNRVLIEHQSAGFLFELGFFSVGYDTPHSTSIPEADQYEKFRATGFTILADGHGTSINAVAGQPGDPSITGALRVTVSLVPLPGGMALLSLPLTALVSFRRWRPVLSVQWRLSGAVGVPPEVQQK